MILLITILSYSFSSCNREVLPLASSKCEFPFGSGPLTTTLSDEDSMYRQPCFNPRDRNEFVYYFEDNKERNFQLVKYNLKTQQKSVLYQSKVHKIAGRPSWSKNGWIAFTRTTGMADHIFIIKDNGDSLRQFTDYPLNIYLTWNSNGSALFWRHSPDLSSNYFFKKDLYAPQTDTILRHDDINRGFSFHNDISSKDELFCFTYIDNDYDFYISKVEEFPRNARKLKSLEDYTRNNPFYFLASASSAYLSKHVFISYLGDGIFELDTEKDKLIRIFKTPECVKYLHISCSPDDRFLLAEREDARLEYNANNVPTGRYIIKSSICLIDTYTLKETIINLK